jgi:hypothetical protein
MPGFHQAGLLKSLFFGKKNKKSFNNYKTAMEKLELVKIELEEKINGYPTHIESLALRLLDIVECKKIIQCESNKNNRRLKILIEKLALLKEKWEERINGQPVDVEDLKTMCLEVEGCKSIIGQEMYALYPFPIGIS